MLGEVEYEEPPYWVKQMVKWVGTAFTLLSLTACVGLLVDCNDYSQRKRTNQDRLVEACITERYEPACRALEDKCHEDD